MIKAKLLHRVGDLRIAKPRSYKDIKSVRIGSRVYASQQLGRVIDIIGPVRRPYIVIKPNKPYPVDDIYGVEVEIV